MEGEEEEGSGVASGSGGDEIGSGSGNLGKEDDDSPSPSTPSPTASSSPSATATVAMIASAAAPGGGGGPAVSGMGVGTAATMTTTTVTATTMLAMGWGGVEDQDLLLARKKKRGRPRKYGPVDDGGVHLHGFLTPFSPAAAAGSTSAADVLFSVGSASANNSKRGRGRPPGSGRCQLLAALGEWFAYSAGGNFTPHVVTIAAGEDVATRILSFSQKGPRAICILSANGAISNVTLRQPGSSGGTLTYEGRFEILSLSGSFTITDSGGVRSRTGGISVSLAGPDGRVVGGGVAGLLLAASPIQAVVGSFLPNTLKEHKRKSNPELSPFLAIPTAPGVMTVAKPISQSAPYNECETPSSMLHGQSPRERENSMNNSTNPKSVAFRSVNWHGLQSSSEHNSSPDINICLHGE